MSKKKVSLGRKLVFSLIPLVCLLLLLEVGIRCVYFQRNAPHAIALKLMANNIKNAIAKVRAAKVAGKAPKVSVGALHEPMGAALLREFQQQYREAFEDLLSEVRENDAKLILLYVPYGDYTRPRKCIAACRVFFRDLAAKHEVDFLDLAETFEAHAYESVTLSPQNAHLSRFGNQVVVKALEPLIRKYDAHRSASGQTKRPTVLGDLRPGVSSIWQMNPGMPYRVTVNKQGFRMDYELPFPKQNQRILALGDSYTFGPYLNDHDTYPALLDARYPEKEVANAGVCGYSILQEASLFSARAKFCQPDIVILQVGDNDLNGFFFFEKNIYARMGRVHYPSETEKAFLQALEESRGQ